MIRLINSSTSSALQGRWSSGGQFLAALSRRETHELRVVDVGVLLVETDPRFAGLPKGRDEFSTLHLHIVEAFLVCAGFGMREGVLVLLRPVDGLYQPVGGVVRKRVERVDHLLLRELGTGHLQAGDEL